MTAIVEMINAAGRAFVEFALPMLIQSCALILVLLAVDLILCRRVRAVFRYCVWMLVLVKLVLPPTFWSPVSIGTWFGDSLKAPEAALVELAEPRPAEPAGETRTMAEDILSPSAPAFMTAPVSPVDDPRPEAPYLPAAAVLRDNSLADADSESLPGAVAASPSAEPSLSWQGLVFLSWAAVATALLLLLVQRAFFVRGLVLDADEASAALQDELGRCRRQIGLRKEIALKLSALAGSPAACGLAHPVILIPQNLAPRLQSHDLQAVLLHELAHVKRGDLWVSLAQTLLQIVYFYNPLLWVANSLIRRTREQAVDEAVLVAMGEAAQQYPETLVNVAKLAFRKRPALSLRLLGVVESKSALSARIRHILNRPLPKTARLGIAGLTIILVTAAVLLPMARAQRAEVRADTSRIVLLPNCGVALSGISGQDLPVLDLAGGKVLVLPAVKNEEAFLEMIGARDAGDLLYYYDRAEGAGKITFLRGAKPDWLSAGNRRIEYETATIAITAMKMPLETTITTRGGDQFNVTIARADKEGCSIEFSPLEDAGGTFKATLAGGVTVELIGASEHPSADKPWWRPDGLALEEAPYDQIGGEVHPGDSEAAFEFAVRLSGLPAGAETTMKTEPEGSRTGGGSPPRRDGQPVDDVRWLATVLPKNLQSCTVLFGVAAGEWETIAQHGGIGSSSLSTASGGVSFSPAMERSDDGVAITVTDDMTDRPCRIVAVLKDGTTVESSEALTSSVGKARQTTVSFKNLTLAQVADFRFETRPWTWVEFRNVSLRPGHKTDVESRIDAGAGQPVRARIASSDAGAESGAPIDLGSADETGGSYVKVILGWSGQEVNVPGPLVLPENVKGMNEFQRWQKGLVRDRITFVDAGGRKCVVECKGMGKSPDGSARAEYIVTRYRPDQTPLAHSYFSRGDELAAEWQTYFPNGAKKIWGLNRPDAADCKMTIRFYGAEGLKTCEWHVNEHNVAYAEQIFDPNGASRFSHYLKDQIHSAYAPIARPALAEPAALASTDKGAGGGALAESGRPAAKLPNGVTVRFLAYSQLTPSGLQWWDVKSDLASIPGVVEADVEGLGTVLAFQIDPPQTEISASLARGAGIEEFKTQWQLGNSGTWLFAIGDQRSYANVSISTLVRDPPVVGLIPLTGEDQGKAVEVNQFGVAQIVDLQVTSPGKGKREEGAGMEGPVIQFTVVKSPISSPSVVAVEDKGGLAHELSNLSDNRQAATYRVALWPEQLASLVVEASLVRQSHVQFRNISLAPDRTTKVQVEMDPTPTVSWFRSKVSQAFSGFADAIKQYLKDQNGQLPVSLEGMKGYLPEDNWLTEHLAYIAKGGPVPSGGSSVIVAYDKTLLPQGKGTYVVYASIYGGLVQFKSPKQLAELGILPSGQAAQPTPISESVAPTGKTPSPSVAATLANGVKLELLAYSRWTQEQLTWYTPAGTSVSLPGVNEADIEGLGTVLAFRTEPAIHTLYVWSVQAPNESTSLEKKWRLDDGNIWLVALGKTGPYVNIEIQAVIADALVVRPVALKRPGTGSWIAVEECGIRAVRDLTAIDSDSSRFQVHWEMLGPRVVAAVDTAGDLHPVRVTAPPRLSDPGAGAAASYEVGLPPDRLASIVVEGYSDRGARASFRNVSLTPSRPTPIRVDVTPQQQGPWWRESPHYKNMEHLGIRLSRYAENHGGSYPATLSVLKDTMSETEWQWLEQNAVYLGAGGSPTQQAAAPLGYDKTLLPLGFGTYVLRADGRVEFEVPNRLRELGIPADGAARTQAAPGATEKMPPSAGAMARRSGTPRDNMLLLGLAIVLHANEHNGDLPPALEPLGPYLPDPQILAWLKDNAIYVGKGNLKDYPAAYSVVTAYEKTAAATGERYVVFLDGHVELAKPERLKELGLTTAEPPSQPAGDLARLVKEAQPGATVTIPKGTYRTPIEIAKPLVLRGESQEGCIIEVTADQPAILVNAASKGNVTVENVTIRWQLAGDKKMDLPAALLVKDTNALIRNCRFLPLGDAKRSPMAVYIDGRSKSTVDNCRFNGFEYTVCYGQGTEGVVQDCIIADCGHQGVINYDGATLTVQRCIITGSKFHAVRCTGGVLHVKDNLLVKNANRGIYLGNKTGRGTITNNLIVDNGTGISGFGRANYVVANNVIVNNSYAGIDMRDSCRLSVRDNVLVRNQRGVVLFKEGTENFNVLGKNAYWGNVTDTENIEKAAGSVAADPRFVDPNRGDFSVQERGQGLTDPKVIQELWKRYEQLKAEPARSNPPPTSASSVTTPASTGFSGRVVDPRGSPVAGAQVALCTKDKGVSIGPTGLLPNKMGGRSTEIVQTDPQGRFSFAQAPEEFQLVAAHESGFAWVTDKELASSHDLPLQPWGRIEGTLRIGRETGDDKDVSLLGYINRDAIDQGVRYDYQTKTDAKGWFLFKKVPPGWMEVGYTTQMGDATWSDTCRTPVRVEPGESVKMMLGGTGRPVVGRFVPPKDYDGPVYFGQGLRALTTVRPETPKPANYDQMTQRQRSERNKQWYQTPEARAFYDAIWHDLSRRHYTFRINEDGSFRIEDVTPGKYRMTVYLEERLGEGRPEEIGGYSGTIEVPPMAQAYTDEPLDVGELTPTMRRPLHVGDTAPPFGARTLDGKDIHLADYKGKFVLLSFWQPEFHPELDRIKELYETYSSAGKLQIIGLGGDDTLEEIKKYVAEHKIEWPEVYFGEKWDEGAAGQYGLSGLPYILLVNPEGKIAATWLRGEKLTSAVTEVMKNAVGSAPGESPAAGAGLAWQRTDRYVPPDPNSFFPDDPEAGKRLDALFNAGDRDGHRDQEILSTVRQGFRRMTPSRNSMLQWVGRRFIWGKEPQHPEAIELMYHAIPLERYYAVYSGLSVVKNKSPNLLRTLADICMQGEQVGRITWGLGPQREEMLAYITPYLQDADPKKREIADTLVKHFRGELDFEKWQQEKHTEQVKAEFTGQLPQLRQALLTGDSQARRDVFQTIMRKELSPILDASFLPALRAAATDSDSSIRAQAAQLVGGLWVWGAKDQDPNAIGLLLALSSDSDREVRYTAVYYGLSNVRNAGEPIVRRLIEMAMADHENNLYGRIVWGLKGPLQADPELVTKALAGHLDQAKSDVRHAASVYVLYRDLLEKEPPSEWNLTRIKEQYPEDLFAVPFGARVSFTPANADALWDEFARSLPQGITAERLFLPWRQRDILCVAKVRGKEQVEAVKDLIENHPRLSLKEVFPLSLSFQLYFEELSALAALRAPGESLATQTGSGTDAPSPTSAATAIAPQTPGLIQQRIDAAAPGATIKLEPGLYKERLTINKPITLEGAGWDKTIILRERRAVTSSEEIESLMAQRISAAKSDAEREQIIAQMKKELTEQMSPVALSVENAQDVVIRGIKFTSPGPHIQGGSMNVPIVQFDRSSVRFSRCAVVAGPGDGIHVLDGSTAEIDNTLVAAVWGTGIVVRPSKSESRVHIHDSDIRNCHYAGIRVAQNGPETVIERCRISGAAWHGIRYDDTSPQILGNLIFSHARSGIYASGRTAAIVKGNFFSANEMCGMSCWFQNKDLIEGNTFVSNKEAGLAIAGASKPLVQRNIFSTNPVAISLGNIGEDSPFAKSDGTVALQGNLLWGNEQDLQFRRDANTTEALAIGEDTNTLRVNPGFADPGDRDFPLRADSPARLKGIGAVGLIPVKSPWPLQPEELAIIPKGDTRDSRQWRQ